MGTTDTGLVPIVTGGGPTVNFSAEAIRYLAFSGWTEGILDSSRITIAEAGTPNMTVDVTLADEVIAVIEGDTADGQGKYVVKGDGSTYSVSITAADATNPRVDLLVMEVKDTQYDASGLRTVRLRTVDGTPTAGATLANRNGAASLTSLPDSAIPIGDIQIPATDTSIEDAQIGEHFYPAAPGYRASPLMAAIYLANSGAPTHNSSGAIQHLGAGGGTDTWTSAYDVRPPGLAAQCDTTTGTAKLTCRVAGLYRINGNVYFTSITAAKVIGAYLYVNGADVGMLRLRTTGAASAHSVPVNGDVVLAAGDYVDLRAYQNDSASEAYETSFQHHNRLSWVYLGAVS